LQLNGWEIWRKGSAGSYVQWARAKRKKHEGKIEETRLGKLEIIANDTGFSRLLDAKATSDGPFEVSIYFSRDPVNQS
jgi:hypothetical protein